ncbi:hypothetical protein [Actinocrispum sp. NPDC049592]|uniref:HD domain-containing protein n=1 Tax=Actinocrispum sp. NPDC049592 TaxID=3154835 RepID=UPI003419FB16
MRDEWNNAVSALGGSVVSTDLETRYAEPHRKYHNATHIHAVLRDATLLVPSLDPVLVLAICAHDVIYNAHPGDDERESAAWARTWLTSSAVAEPHIAAVESHILATITHTSENPATQVLLDADLAILAAEPDAYDVYIRCVRAEYASYAEPEWRAGRAKVLSSLLTRDPLYQTPRAQTLWTTQARTNLNRELTTLT